MKSKWVICATIVMMLFMAFTGCVDNGEVKRFEHYTEMHSIYKNIFDNYWSGQTFSINESHYITQVKLYISKVGMPNGDIIVGIQGTVEKYPGFYVPDGGVLVSCMIPCNLLPDVSPKWVNFTIEDTKLESGKTYAIIVSAMDANETAHPRWERVQDIGNYSGGTVISSSNYGEYWGIIFDDDFLFEEFGKIA